MRLSQGGGTSSTTAAGITVLGGQDGTSIGAAAAMGAVLTLVNTNNTDNNQTSVDFSNSNTLSIAKVIGKNDSHSSRNGSLIFATSSAAAPAERARIDSSGRLLIGTTTEGNATGDNLTISDSGNMGMTLRSTDSNYCNIYFSDAETGTAEYEGYISYNHNTNSLEFATGHTERLRILSSGGLTFNGDTATANALNDYEEGTVTFASTNGGVTFDSNYKGRYTKIGELVTVSGYLVFSSVTNSGTALRVQMPFTSAANSEGYYTRGVGAVFYKYINTPTNQPNLVAYVGGGENYMRFYSSGDNTDWHQTDHNQVSTSTHIYFNICYTTTS